MADVSNFDLGNGKIVNFKDAAARTALGSKANKVTNATNGNFASLDSNGNLTDSGKKASDFMASDGVSANPTGTSVGTLSSLGINGDKYEIPSGGGLPNGSTVTPTDNIQTWLACAGLHQSYTTLNEVLADSAVLSALMASTNAVDYLVRSTTWATDICSNETAMNCIGVNDYCADILRSNSTWLNAICNSAYFEEVLNVHVPKMTGYTTPSGEVIYNGSIAGYQIWNCFDKDVSNGGYLYKAVGIYIGYDFKNPIRINKVVLTAINFTRANNTGTLRIIASNDKSTWVELNSFTASQNESKTIILNNQAKYRYYAVQVTAFSSMDGEFTISEIQFYGRGKSPVVDTKADISAIAPEEAGSISSRAYAVGEHFYKNSKFCTPIASIAQGAQFTLGTNYVEGTVASVLKRDDFITTSPYYQSSKDSYLTINGRHYIKTTSVPCYSCCYLDTSNNTCPLFISTYPDGVHYYVPPVSGVNPEAHFEYVQTFVEHNKTRWFCSDKGYLIGANVNGDRKLSGRYDTIEAAANALLSIIYG